jgi:glutamine synthetase
MSLTVDDVFKIIKDKEVKFVDLRFTDTRGKEQHVTVPVKYFNKDKFESGHAFDGSSIAGWKGIQASDMLLMPDPVSSRMDPFTDEPVLNISCDVIEPGDGKPYDRDPRSIAKKAEATSSRAASATCATSARSPSSSSSTASPGRSTCRAAR